MELFITLLAIHFLCDFALQNDFVAINKARSKNREWWIILMAHCFIHGLGVWGVLRLYDYDNGVAIASLIFMVTSHFVIDMLKCDGRFSFKVDQLLHVFILLIISFAV